MPTLDKKYNDNQVMSGCRTYFSTLSKESRLQTTNPQKYDETKQEKKMRARRNRLLNARRIHLQGEEENRLMADVTQEVMSDEEVAGDGKLKVKSLTWRQQALTALIRTLDARREEERLNGAKQGIRLKRVTTELPMKRRPSKKVKATLIVEESSEVEEISEGEM